MKKQDKDNIVISILFIILIGVAIYVFFIKKEDDPIIEEPQTTQTVVEPEDPPTPKPPEEQHEQRQEPQPQVEADNIVIKLKGDSLVKINEDSNYSDAGATCTNNGKDCTKALQYSTNLDKTRVGYYNASYTYTINNKKYTVSRVIEVLGDNYKISLSNTDLTNQDVIITLTSNINLEVFNYILDPNNKKYTTEQITYTVSKNGEYIFKIYKKDNTYIEAKINITNINKTGESQQPQQPQGGTQQETGVRKPADANYIYESDTLKYYIVNNEMGYVSYIWVKDPYNQIKTELGGDPSGLRPTSEILSSAVGNNGLSGKGLIGVNGSAFSSGNFQPELQQIDPDWENSAVTPIVIYKGKLIRNSSVKFGAINDYFYVYGITKNNELKYYSFWNYIQYDEAQNLVKEIQEEDGVKYTFGFKSVYVENYQAQIYGETDKASRTAICQVDTNNFILISTPVISMHVVASYLQSQGCRIALNLDGGGSQNLFYKRNDTGLQALLVTSRPVADAVFFHEK